MESSPLQQTSLVLPSNRSFGLLFAVVFALVAVWPLFFGGAVRNWAGALSAVFAATALLTPKLLAPLNRGWMRFGAHVRIACAVRC